MINYYEHCVFITAVKMGGRAYVRKALLNS